MEGLGDLSEEPWFHRGPARVLCLGAWFWQWQKQEKALLHQQPGIMEVWQLPTLRARLSLWPLLSLLEASSWHTGLWPALPPFIIEVLGWEPGLLRAFLRPAPITRLRRFSAKLWLKLWPEGEKEKMGEGMEWVLKSSEQSYPCGARENHLAGAAWNWCCVGLGFR